jgi:inorganic pyrophosphatase
MAKSNRLISAFDILEPIDAETELVQVVIETPRGCRNKYKYDDELHVFRLNSVLPAGSAFPYDFGYVPGTMGDDGDPLDVLLLMDQPAFTGCVVQARLIGVIEATQTEDGEVERNDRLVAVANDAHDYRDLTSLKEMNTNLLSELEHFFTSYNQQRGREFKLIAHRGPSAAKKLLKEGIARKVDKSNRKSTVKK